MAKLIGVYRDENHQFAPRQLPLLINETLTLVVHFPDSCLACGRMRTTQRDVDKFKAKFKLLSRVEKVSSLTVPFEDLITTVNKIVPCVGCRKSVERLFNQLVESGHAAIEPLLVTADSEITVFEDLIQRPKALATLFHLYGQKVNDVIDAIPKTKKNRRCVLHSLDSQRAKPPSWLEVWDLMSQECQEEVIVVECDVLQETLETFLKKHRFCGDCKSKVMKAYNILVGEIEAPKDDGYVGALYQGIRCCPTDGHVHVDGDVDFIASLIERAEPELQGSRRERHAKTLEIAQEEVLTCLGVCLYEKLVTIWQRLREEEQTWQLLFYLGIHSIRQRFELTVEKKQGFSQLELICEEITRAEQAKELRKEHKRQKKRKRRNKVEKLPENILDQDSCECVDEVENQNGCEWEVEEFGCPVECRCESSKCDGGFCEHDHKPQECPSSTLQHSCSQCTCLSGSSSSLKVNGFYSDCGYSSGASHESFWSTSSSCESSEVACTEGFCNHEGDVCLCNSSDSDMLRSCKDCCSKRNSQTCLGTSKTKNDTLKKWNDATKKRGDMSKTRNDPSNTRNNPSNTRNNPSKTRNDPSRTRNDPSKTRNDPSKTRNDPSKTRNDPSKTRNDPSKTRNDMSKTRNRTSNTRDGTSNTRDEMLNPLVKPYNVGPSIQDMLQECTKSEDKDDPYIIPAEMTRLQAQLPQLNRKRLELRLKLRQQFAELQNSNKHFQIRPRTPQLQ